MFEIAPHVETVVIAVLALLCVASLSRVWMGQRQPERDLLELKQRIRSWWWMIGLLFVVLLLNRDAGIVFFACLSYLALKEFFSIVPTRLVDRRVLFWAYLAIPLQYLWIWQEWYGMFSVFVPVYVFLFLPVRMLLLGDSQGFIRAAGVIHWMVMLAIYCIGHLAALLTLPVLNPAAGYLGPVLFVLFITQFNDVCQYVWGKRIGKRPILPRVSPNKTWGGFLGGGLTVTLCAGLVGPYLTGMSWSLALAAGAVIAVCGFFGDVVISSVKRDLGIKDTGQLIPGHGGILDRLDSIIYTAPVFFHFYRYFAY
ncbi:phosphatidate cytidylyltransferase [Salinicola avicenniae]|uniref:phosphatidate cytidylyltransferase n=1 Tax=Salinicola avicenniae TaxID=2916836 RepID=UPI00207480F6|nr:MULTISPECIES: phosphatidate cytidylyltransferase [unclassified Salinicola]